MAYATDVGKIQGQSRVSRRVSRGAVEGQSRIEPCATSSSFFFNYKHLCNQTDIMCNYLVNGTQRKWHAISLCNNFGDLVSWNVSRT